MYLLGNWVSPEEGTKNIIKRNKEENVRGITVDIEILKNIVGKGYRWRREYVLFQMRGKKR